MIENGLYKLKEKYYSDFPNENHIHIKAGRPFYYAVKSNHGIYWLIPISSQAENYKRKIREVENKRGEGNCILYHIGNIANRERAFIICNILPVTVEYIEDTFTIDNKHYIVKNQKLIREVSEKTRNYIKQLELGRMYSQIDALAI